MTYVKNVAFWQRDFDEDGPTNGGRAGVTEIGKEP